MTAFRTSPTWPSSTPRWCGAGRDGIFTVGELRRTAAAYQTEAEIVAGMGHDLMLDQGWAQVADRIACWVRELPAWTAPAVG